VAGRTTTPRCLAKARIARASGCSLRASKAPTRSSSSRSSCPASATISITSGFPQVNVPVLSSATAFRRDGISRNSPPLTSTPFLAAEASAAQGERQAEQESHRRPLEPFADRHRAEDGDRHQQVHVGTKTPQRVPRLGQDGPDAEENREAVEEPRSER